MSECGIYKTVKAIFWPWLRGTSPLILAKVVEAFKVKVLSTEEEDEEGEEDVTEEEESDQESLCLRIIVLSSYTTCMVFV